MTTSSKSTVLLKHHLKALRLPTILSECDMRMVARIGASQGAEQCHKRDLHFALGLST